jgi:hypothetical protein
MRLELDYIAPPRRPLALGVGILVLSVAVSIFVFERYRNIKSEIALLEAAESMLPAERKPLARKNLDAELKNADAVMRQLALPWAAMVGAVEGAARPEIALMQMQPDAQQRQLRLTAEAPSEKAMLDYLSRLAAAPVLGDVYIASHQVMLEDPRRPIQFTVLARVKGLP